MTKVLENEEFNSIHIDEGGVFNSLRFEKCLFQSCSILSRKLNDNSDLPPRFENILIKDCTVLNCVSGPAFLKDVTVENLRTGDIFLIYSTMFHHVTLKGKLGAIKINKKDYVRDYDSHQRHIEMMRTRFYSQIDWAMDISQAKFLSFSCKGIPAKLIRRDSETQFVVTRKRFNSMDVLNAEFKGQYPFIYLLLELFLESDEDDQVLVTPLGKAKKYYQPILEGFRELRRAGILEPD